MKTCRIVVLGAAQNRVAKVVSLLREDEKDPELYIEGITVQFLPCVARFDSYEDADGNNVRYLLSIDYYTNGGKDKSETGLLPFFDEVPSQSDKIEKEVKFFGVSGVAVGAGIEDEEDLARIDAYFKTLSRESVEIDCIKPTPEYATMKEELAAYRELDDEQKKTATRLKSMGPGRMAKFASDFAHRIVTKAIEDQRQEDVPVQEPGVDEAELPSEKLYQRQIDPNKNRYSCRKCRHILFGEDDFQDPPHEPSKHRFSYRNHGAPNSAASMCHSHFLQDALDWMGHVSMSEGKFGCPKCEAKLGTWNWSGAQCSCGTWVVPAIQVPRSKVDLVSPHIAGELPTGTVVSPVVQQLM